MPLWANIPKCTLEADTTYTLEVMAYIPLASGNLKNSLKL